MPSEMPALVAQEKPISFILSNISFVFSSPSSKTSSVHHQAP